MTQSAENDAGGWYRCGFCDYGHEVGTLCAFEQVDPKCAHGIWLVSTPERRANWCEECFGARRVIPPESTEPEGEFRATETQGVYTYHPRVTPPEVAAGETSHPEKGDAS